MSTVCQPGDRSGPSTGSWIGAKPLVDALNRSDELPLCQVTAFDPLTGCTSTASSSPSAGQWAPLVSQNPVQLAMTSELPGSAGKYMSASTTPDETVPGLISPAQLPALPLVVSVASPLESVPTLPSPTNPVGSGE